jgi:hypothetical protein
MDLKNPLAEPSNNLIRRRLESRFSVCSFLHSKRNKNEGINSFFFFSTKGRSAADSCSIQRRGEPGAGGGGRDTPAPPTRHRAPGQGDQPQIQRSQSHHTGTHPPHPTLGLWVLFWFMFRIRIQLGQLIRIQIKILHPDPGQNFPPKNEQMKKCKFEDPKRLVYGFQKTPVLKKKNFQTGQYIFLQLCHSVTAGIQTWILFVTN